MKRHKRPYVDKLLIDVIEYAFTEWLVRRKIFTAFKKNCDYTPSSTKSFRDYLRDHIRFCLRHSSLDPGCLISSAFTFLWAPEGVEFWLKHSEAWKRFYSKFQTKKN